MKQIPFSELLHEMYPLVLHNIDLIRLWNDYDGITHTFNGHTLHVKTQILEPLKDVVPNSLTFKDHKVGNFKMSQESDTLIKIDRDPEGLLYSGEYNIKITLRQVLVSVDLFLKDPILALYGIFVISISDPTFSLPDTSFDISPLSKSTLNDLHLLSKRMRSNRIKHLRSLVTKIENQKFSSKNVRNKFYDQLNFIKIFQQSFMELDHPDLLVFYPKINFFIQASTASISWAMLDVHQSIKSIISYRYRSDAYSRADEYVLGWQVLVEIYN